MNTEEVITKYNSLLDNLQKNLLSKTNFEYRELAEKSYLTIFNILKSIEKKDDKYYDEMLEKAGIKNYSNTKDEKTNINDNESVIDANEKTDINKEKDKTENKEDNSQEFELASEEELLKYIEQLEKNSPEIKVELINLSNKLKSDLENPNDTLIETWVNNYKDFIKKNNLDEKIMMTYMMKLFKLYDIHKKYTSYYEKLKDNSNSLENETDKNSKNDKDSKKDSDTLGNEVGDNHTNDSQEQKDNKVSEEPLKIVNVSKAPLSFKEKAVLAALGLVCASTPVSLLGFAIGAVAYKKLKNTKYKERVNYYLNKNNLKLNDNNEVVDSNGNKITVEKVGKDKYNFYKNSLLDLGAFKKGKLINKSYKVNKLKSMFLKSLPSAKQKFNNIIDNAKQKFSDINNSEDLIEENEQMEDAKKGLGRL